MKNYKSFNDEYLIECLKGGDARGFEEIYDRYWYKLFGVAYHQLGSKEEAEQIVQDVFEKLWKRRAESNILHLGVYLVSAGYEVVLAGKSHVKYNNVFDWAQYFPPVETVKLPLKSITRL